MRPFESSTVTVLERLVGNTTLSQIDRVVYATIQHLNNSELAAGMKQVQDVMQSIGNEFRGVINEYRH